MITGLLRTLSPLAHPVGFAWLVLIVAAAINLHRRRSLGTAVCSLAAVLMWLAAQPRIMEPLYAGLEKPWHNHTVTDAPTADAVIVLGGGWRPSGVEPRQVDFTDAVDRLVAGVELCRLGRAPVLVLGGDSPAEAAARPGGPSQSDHLRRWAGDWGLKGVEVLTLGPVHTTREEALAAAALQARHGWKKILLVTSAFHMRRARSTFEKQGVAVHPVACDFRFGLQVGRAPGWRLFPDEGSLADLAVWWHEQLGWLVYRAIGSL